MKLLYIWIKTNETGYLKDLDVNFTSKYNFKFKSETNELTCSVKEEDVIDENFFSSNKNHTIQQVNAIVGNNGAGKSSILKHLYKTDLPLMERYKDKHPYWETIQVYEFDDGIHVYYNTEKEIKKIKEEIGTKTFEKHLNCKKILFHKIQKEFLTNGVFNNITKIYLSNSGFDYLNSAIWQPKTSVIKIAITDYDINVLSNGFFQKCKMDNGNQSRYDNFHKINSILKLNKEIFQGFLYMIMFCLLKQKVNNNFTFLKSMQHMKLKTNNNADFVLDLQKLDLYEFHDFKNIRIDNDSFRIKGNFEFKHFLNNFNYEDNIIGNLKKSLLTEMIISFCDVCILYFDKKVNGDQVLINLVSQINEQINNNFIDKKRYNIYNIRLKYYKNACKRIDKLQSIIGNDKEIFLTNFDKKLCKFFIEEFKGTGDLSELFDIKKTNIDNLNYQASFIFKYLFIDSSYISSGEKAITNLFSWLYCILNIDKVIDGRIKKNILLFVDEIDLYCHPEWQRSILNDFINCCEENFADNKIHLIYTTHSPITLSDIPKENVLFLKHNDNDKCEIVPNDSMVSNTFGANIYDLYNNSFFLENGFIGEFAQTKINNAIDIIKTNFIKEVLEVDMSSKKPLEENKQEDKTEYIKAKKVAELIGEPILYNKLKNMITEIDNKTKEEK